MKKGVKILIIILCLIIASLLTFIIVDKLVLEKKHYESNSTVTSNELTNTTKDSNTNANAVDNTNNINNSGVKKISIDDKTIIEILKYEEPFSNGKALSNEQYLSIAYNAINEGYVVIDKNRSPEVGGSSIKFTVDEINSIIYSIFGVTLSRNESLGTVMRYENGAYTFEFSDRGATVNEAVIIQEDAAAGTSYITYDLYQNDMGEKEKLGTYVLGISSNDSFVTSLKKLEKDINISNNKNQNIKNDSIENKTVNNKLNVNGSYKYEDQTDNYYHRSNIVIKNQTDTSINFSINAAHGNDVDHVNIGEVSGIANRIDIPTDSIVPESEQIAYQYTENIDGNINKITLIFTAHRQFQYIEVTEEYPSGMNPYAGNRVYFSGEYEKIN